jgi:hypothetical protein
MQSMKHPEVQKKVVLGYLWVCAWGDDWWV